MAGMNESVTGPNTIAITGTAKGNETVGVLGKGDAQGIRGEGGAVGVRGIGKDWHGIAGLSKSTRGGAGVFGHHDAGGTGVHGKSVSTIGSPGVFGEGDPGPGVIGRSTQGIGVHAESMNGQAGVWGEHKGAGIGVRAVSKDGAAVAAVSISNEAIHAETRSPGTAAIAAYNLNPEGTGAAVFAKKEGGKGHAGFFDGNVWIGGELGVGRDIILASADCAEDFEIVDADRIDPGTVMVVGEKGALRECCQAYDKRVAGVVSGAGDFKPGIVLDKQHAHPDRKPIALLGKTFCKVDAHHGAIEVGDLLTTSSTPGHAMKAADSHKAFGAVIGKALRPLQSGQGLIPILIALQ
jgi:hypothetical protein